ncbi:hypothetical protein DPEC_G00311760 [Dallia pectoralis]|uniref:Uncharacterized protein n=1 Tax=Dallia pectoralis TaxID=75939 RepID=A0ACC2FBM2_DALPE|nr:hypothetical protein DPEC_G00311760 [Dallia pectoralis]
MSSHPAFQRFQIASDAHEGKTSDMSRQKGSKSNKNSCSSVSEELTRIVENAEFQDDDSEGEGEVVKENRTRSQLETYLRTRDTPSTECESPVKSTSPTPKPSREVHIAFLPDRYKPLVEEQNCEGREERKRERKKERHKKYRKNIRKALHFSWKCLVAGLQGLAGGYTMPLASTLVTNIHRTNR